MSDIRRVVRDTKRGAEVMSEVAVQKAHGWLEALMRAHHRGPTDTWTAARDRAAKAAGVDPTYAKRLWQRWQTMKDVSGGAFLALQEAYEAQCQHNEAMAAHHRAVREAIDDGATDEDLVAAGLGIPPTHPGKANAEAKTTAGRRQLD